MVATPTRTRMKCWKRMLIIGAFAALLGTEPASGEHWPNYWNPINHGDEPIVADDRTNVPPPEVVPEQRTRHQDAGLIGRRQLYLDVTKNRPLAAANPGAMRNSPIIGHHHPIPESNSKLLPDDPSLSSDWVPMQADPMKGDPLFEYIPPALQTVKLGDFQGDSEEEEKFEAPPRHLVSSYSNERVNPASLLLASTLMLNNPLPDDPIDRSDTAAGDREDESDEGDGHESALVDDTAHPYYGAGRIKVAMDDPNSKERLPFTHSQGSQYLPVDPSQRRTTIMPLTSVRDAASEELDTTTVTAVEHKTTSKLIYQAPPRRTKTTEQPPQAEGEEPQEESLLSFLQNWLQASSSTPEQHPPTPTMKTSTTTSRRPTTTSTPATVVTEVDSDEGITAQVTTTDPPVTAPKIKLEQRHKASPSSNAERFTTGRPVRFPSETTTKGFLTSVEELAHAVRPIVSSVPFVIVQGHSKVKMYGVNTLESAESEKQAPGSKAESKEKRKDSVEQDIDSSPASTESQEVIENFNRDAAVVRPIATKQPRPPRPQQQLNKRPSDFRFPNQKKGANKRPQGPPPPRIGGPVPRPQLRPMRPVFFTKRNPPGAPSTHSNPFEYFSQLARLTASRIKAPAGTTEEPGAMTPRG